MELSNIEGVRILSSKELKTIDGGAIFAACICLFALGMAVGLCIGSLRQRR